MKRCSRWPNPDRPFTWTPTPLTLVGRSMKACKSQCGRSSAVGSQVWAAVAASARHAPQTTRSRRHRAEMGDAAPETASAVLAAGAGSPRQSVSGRPRAHTAALALRVRRSSSSTAPSEPTSPRSQSALDIDRNVPGRFTEQASSISRNPSPATTPRIPTPGTRTLVSRCALR